MTGQNIMNLPRKERAGAVYPLLLQHIVPGEKADRVLGVPGPWLRLDTTAMNDLLGRILDGRSLTGGQLNQLNYWLKAEGFRITDGNRHYVLEPSQVGDVSVKTSSLVAPPAAQVVRESAPMSNDELRSLVKGLVRRIETLKTENTALRQENEQLRASGVPDDVAALLRNT